VRVVGERSVYTQLSDLLLTALVNSKSIVHLRYTSRLVVYKCVRCGVVHIVCIVMSLVYSI
jgi:hypothetical protein